MIEVAAELRRDLLLQCGAAAPRECCGFLLGASRGGRHVARRVVATSNPVAAPGGFAIPDHELRRVRRVAADAGLDILAVYHSHPSGSLELSERDREALAHSEWPWIVVAPDPAGDGVRLREWSAPRGAIRQRARGAWPNGGEGRPPGSRARSPRRRARDSRGPTDRGIGRPRSNGTSG
jgi:proteasome lid subunit RPN8/RPN11